MAVRTVGKANGIQSPFPEQCNIVRSILHLDIGTDLRLFLHETENPVWYSVAVKPFNRLLHCRSMEVMNIKPVSNNPDTISLIGEHTKILSGSGNHLHGFKQRALCYSETVQTLILTCSNNTPFRHAVGNFTGKPVQRTFKPL